jgi:hypothetical protein
MAERAPVSRPPNPRLERTGGGRPLSRRPFGLCLMPVLHYTEHFCLRRTAYDRHYPDTLDRVSPC